MTKAIAKTLQVEIAEKTEYAPIGAPFIETMEGIARKHGIRHFRLLMADIEIEPSRAPAVVQRGQIIRIVPFDSAG